MWVVAVCGAALKVVFEVFPLELGGSAALASS